jgi:hypothetical protein
MDSAYALFDARVRKNDGVVELRQLTASLANRTLDSITLIGFRQEEREGFGVVQTLSYQIRTGGQYFAGAVAMTPGRDAQVIGFNLIPLTASLESLHRFTLRGKSLAQYVWLAFGLASLATCLASAGLITWRGRPGKKWVWAALALVTAPTFTMNWTTGEAKLGAATVFGVVFYRASPWSSWIVGFGLPIGAALALSRSGAIDKRRSVGSAAGSAGEELRSS